MASVDTLYPSVWSISSLPESLTLTRFRVPSDAHATLGQWCREKLGREGLPVTTVLRGLSEILAWFVPEVAFMRHDREPGDTETRLCLYFQGDVTVDPEVQRRVHAGLTMWLSILYPDRKPQVRERIAAAAADVGNWKRLEVSTALRDHDGECGVPVDRMLWDSLAVHAVSALSGKALRFRSGEARVLVPRTAQSDPFGGVELVSFPPKRNPNGQGLWSEVINVSTASFPERRGIYVLARPSIRNWGPVMRASGANDPARSLEVFIPSRDGDAGHAGYRHTSFEFRAKQDMDAPQDEKGRRPLIGWWQHDDKQRVLDLLRRFTGKKALDTASLAASVVDQDGLWVLPRLGTVHRDKFLPGGSGVPWPDRQDLAESLDKAFEGIGLLRAEPLKRLARVRVPIDGPFDAPASELEKTWPARRAAVLAALKSLGNDTGVLDLFIFQRLEETPRVIAEHLKEFLGKPDHEEGMEFRWNDGITVRIQAHPAGPLSELLPWVELSDAEKQRRTQKQQSEILRVKREEEYKSFERVMAERIRIARGGGAAVACAVLEMPAELQGNAWRDPFAMARRDLAKQDILPQVVLVESDAAKEEKYMAALRDCFRMLGVVPIENIDGLDLAPAAMTVIQRNDAVVGGGRIKGHAFPLAARVRAGVLECAIPEESGEPKWMPYARAALRILSGDYGRFARSRQEENQARFHAFFSAALEQIDARGAAIVIAEMETIAHRLAALQNGNLVFDRLQVGNQTYAPTDLSNTRIIRTSPDPRKQPHYYHGTENKWPTGIFGWGTAERTAYALKAKPPSVSHESSFASQISRHLPSGDNRPNDDAARLSAQLDEICIAFMQPGDDPARLMSFVAKLRGVHAQFRYDTTKPYPLHELRLLGGGVTM